MCPGRARPCLGEEVGEATLRFPLTAVAGAVADGSLGEDTDAAAAAGGPGRGAAVEDPVARLMVD